MARPLELKDLHYPHLQILRDELKIIKEPLTTEQAREFADELEGVISTCYTYQNAHKRKVAVEFFEERLKRINRDLYHYGRPKKPCGEVMCDVNDVVWACVIRDFSPLPGQKFCDPALLAEIADYKAGKVPPSWQRMYEAYYPPPPRKLDHHQGQPSDAVQKTVENADAPSSSSTTSGT